MSIGGSGSKSKDRSYQGLSLWADPYAQRLAAWAEPHIGQPLQMYPGQMVAPMTPEQMASGGIARTTLQDLATVSPERVQQRWELFGRPAAREAYGGAGSYYSTERMQGEARAAQEYQLAEESRATGAAQALSAYETTGLGGLAQQLEQQRLTAMMQEWLRTQPEYSPYIQYLIDILGLSYYAASKGEARSFGMNMGM